MRVREAEAEYSKERKRVSKRTLRRRILGLMNGQAAATRLRIRSSSITWSDTYLTRNVATVLVLTIATASREVGRLAPALTFVESMEYFRVCKGRKVSSMSYRLAYDGTQTH
jgi:hypothetical protein